MFFNGKERRVVVVSNRLPFYRDVTAEGKSVWTKGAGGLITAMEPILKKMNGIWLGWDGIITEHIDKKDFKLMDIREMDPKSEKEGTYSVGCIPLKREEVEKYYNSFSNGTLWALFHYFFEKSFLDYSAWRSYCEVNKRFAEYTDGCIGDDDLVWIQDFHLFMMPHFLRELRPKQQIHFFLHIPFPHIDIFSILPWQKQIVESLLCCNTIGFQHKQYLRNFSDTVARYTKEKKKEAAGIHKKGIDTFFYVNPISIDFNQIDTISRKPEVLKRKEEILQQAGCSKLILGVDRIDYSKGIKERLLGLEMMLESHPELKEQFFYYQLVIPSREEVESYMILKREIDEIIGRINGKFATGLWAPIHYNYGTVPLEELIALYSAASVALVTPLRDGMNLVCKEYVAAHSDNEGVLVLSKFVGAIAEIKNCLPVNPYSIEDIANAIYQALHMSKAEMRNRMKKMRNNIKIHNINTWLQNCLQSFEQAKIQGSKTI